MKLLSLIFASMSAKVLPNAKFYHNDHLYRIYGDMSNKLSNFNGEIWTSNVDFTDFQVPITNKQNLENFLNDQNVKFDIHSTNIQKMIEESYPTSSKPKDGSFNYTTYHDYPDLTQWMEDFSKTYSNYVSLNNFGTTNDGRYIISMKFSKNAGNDNAMILTGGIHAREWISTAHLVYMANMIIQNEINGGSESLLNGADVYLIPVMNPDGYQWSWTDDRLWRKTRTDYDAKCTSVGENMGADPERNFDAHWDQPEGASTNKCSLTYKGPYPASEQCIIHQVSYMENLLKQYGNVAFLDVHSYSQFWMYPYGYANVLPENAAELDTISGKCVSAIEDTYGTKFKYGSIYNTVYAASGSSTDYYTDSHGVSCAFALELRDTGRYGFLLPDRYIQPVAEEMYNGYMVLMQYVLAGSCPVNV